MISNSTLTSLQGQWVHVAASYSASESATGLVLYLNGSAVAATGSTAGTYTGMSNTAADVTVGCIFRDGSPTFANGLIDEVRIFNRELSAAEVMGIFSSGRE
jgi:hypothetical protein